MRGKYHMCPWEAEKWKQELSVVIARLSYNQRHEEFLTDWDLCPANVCKTLEELGWEQDNMEDNGWQHDTWYYFCHPDYQWALVFYYEGYTFEMKIYRSDIDD